MSLVFLRGVSSEVKIRDGRPIAGCTVVQSGQAQNCVAAVTAEEASAYYPLNRELNTEQALHEAVLVSFCDPPPYQIERLRHLSGKQWQKLLFWLDVSGLALYFLDRIEELQCNAMLPAAIRKRLQQNRIDNTKRTQNMISESVAIQSEFQAIGLSYATMKGFSLCPISVPRPELRHQFDLDFLIAEKDVLEGRRILEERGYRLYAISGKSWEFKKDEKPGGSMEDLYKDSNGRAVELHVESDAAKQSTRLQRVARQDFHGISMPVLSPVDLFLGQGLHAFKDVCSAFSRTAHLLEFRRHVLARYDDKAFWRELETTAGEDRKASLGIGVVVYQITSAMGPFAPEALTKWTVATLPATVRLWVDLYGGRSIYGKNPGTKLYLLLQQELELAGLPAKRSAKKSLLPWRLPPLVIRASPNEPLSIKISRYRLQLRVIFSRLRFHVVEGLRYAKASREWRRHVNRLTQD